MKTENPERYLQYDTIYLIYRKFLPSAVGKVMKLEYKELQFFKFKCMFLHKSKLTKC